MFTMLFGNYLLNKGYISNQQLKEILSKVETSRPRLGVIALSLGYLKPEDVEKIHAEQQRQNKKFGELAVEMGLLTQQQLDKLLQEQPKEYLVLSQVLVDMGIFSFEELNNVLNEFRKHVEISEEDFEALKSENMKALIVKLLNVVEGPKKRYFASYVDTMLVNLVRFITRNVIPTSVEKLEPGGIDGKVIKAANQSIRGDVSLDTCLVFEDEQTAREFAKRYSKVSDESLLDEVLDDSLMEFLNLVNGIYIVNLSEIDINCELIPPAPGMWSEAGDAIVCEFKSDLGDFKVAIA